MKKEKAIELILEEMARAEEIHPVWPLDVVHGAAILAEEVGSVLKAALDVYYDRGTSKNLYKEIIHVGAMAIRFLLIFEDKDVKVKTD